MAHARIIGTGSYLPERVVSNQELESRIDTSDEWIVSRTGIRSRHVAADDETTSDLAVQACLRAMEAAGKTPDDIDLVILATTTEDMVLPATACLVQAKLGIRQGAAFDIQAVCAGFVYALAVADKLVASGQHRCALVVGAEVFSRILDWQDRRTCVLFGDGAGAVVLEQQAQPGILATRMGSDGSLAHILQVSGGIAHGKITGNPYLEMDGQAVYKTAVRVLREVAAETLEAAGLSAADVDWMVPHQANVRILNTTADKLGISRDRMVITLDHQGNTSAASVPLALDAAVRDGRIQPGQTVLLLGMGAGMAWAAALLRL